MTSDASAASGAHLASVGTNEACKPIAAAAPCYHTMMLLLLLSFIAAGVCAWAARQAESAARGIQEGRV
jgi:hypothetical protein